MKSLVTAVNPRTAENEGEVVSSMWLFGVGAIFTIFGIAGLSYSVFATIGSIVLFGFLSVTAALTQLFELNLKKSFAEKAGTFLLSAFYLIMGIACFLQPMSSSVFLTLALGVTMICIGGIKIMNFFTAPKGLSFRSLLVSGILSTMLGISIIMQWPTSALWVIGTIVSIDLLVNGLTYLFQAFRSKSN